MMVNLDVGGYTKTINHRNIIRKMQKKQQPTENQINTKTEYKLSVARFSHLACQEGGKSTLCPLSVTSPAMIFCIYVQ